jgi:hypothetical protein
MKDFTYFGCGNSQDTICKFAQEFGKEQAEAMIQTIANADLNCDILLNLVSHEAPDRNLMMSHYTVNFEAFNVKKDIIIQEMKNFFPVVREDHHSGMLSFSCSHGKGPIVRELYQAARTVNYFAEDIEIGLQLLGEPEAKVVFYFDEVN